MIVKLAVALQTRQVGIPGWLAYRHSDDLVFTLYIYIVIYIYVFMSPKTNLSMDNPPFQDAFSIENGDFLLSSWFSGVYM